MGKRKLLIIRLIGAGVLLLILVLVGPIGTLFQLTIPKHVSGKIYDCVTNQPIEGAQVSIGGVGWGFRNNSLVWDKGYGASDTTNAEGEYFIKYNIGSSMSVLKDAFLRAYYYTSGGDEVDIGLRDDSDVKDKTERTYQCTLESECTKSVVKDGSIISWDSCADPEYQP